MLAAGGGYSLAEVCCPGGPGRFAQPEAEHGHVLVTTYRGAFVRRVAGREVFVDGSVAYLSAPGTVEEFAHPVPGGDVCAVIRFDPGLIASLSGGARALADPALPMNGASELALRQATELARAGDPDGSLAPRG